jgi:ankyrin repeat protein
MPQPSDADIDSAIRARDVTGLIRMLDDGLDANWKDARGDTLLHAAARLGDAELAGKLLEKGARAFVHNDEAETPWEAAVAWGRDNVAKALRVRMDDETLTRGSDPVSYVSLQEIRDKTAETGVNQFHYLAQRGQFGQVLNLAAADKDGLSASDLLSKGLDGDTVLLKICQQGQLPQLAKTELWLKRPQDFQTLWENVPKNYRKDVNYEAFVSALRQAKLQSYGKLKLKGFDK